MIKDVIAGFVVGFLFITPAFAEKVYHQDYGSWTIQGYTDGVDRSCVISTYWSDGKQINVNIFPNNGNVTVTINNPTWSIHSSYNYNSPIYFYYDNGSVTKTIVRLVYKNPHKLIMRNVHSNFVQNFLAARNLIRW